MCCEARVEHRALHGNDRGNRIYTKEQNEMTASTQGTESGGSASEYAIPDVLVSTQWVQDHLNDPNIRIVESDEDVLLYDQGHVPGAVKLDWHADLQDDVVRDYVSRERVEQGL